MRSFFRYSLMGLALATLAFTFAAPAQAHWCRTKSVYVKPAYSYPPTLPPQPAVVVQQPVVVQGNGVVQSDVPQAGVPGQQGFPQQGLPQFNQSGREGFPQPDQQQFGQRSFNQQNQQGANHLQVTDIRLVEPGIPERKLGPRFRLTIRNASQYSATQPVDLLLAGGTSRKFETNLPMVVEQIQSMGPGQTISLEMRLPAEAMAMKYPGEERPAPFNTMFVMLAGQQDLLGNATLKPLSIIPRIGIQMVDLTVHKPADNRVPSGAVLTLAGEGFGIDGGSAMLQLGNLKLHAEVVNWSPMGIQIRLPELAMASPVSGELYVARADGESAQAIQLEIYPAQRGQVQPEVQQAGMGLPNSPGVPQQGFPQGGPQQGGPQQGSSEPSRGEPLADPRPPQFSGASLLRRPPEPPMMLGQGQ